MKTRKMSILQREIRWFCLLCSFLSVTDAWIPTALHARTRTWTRISTTTTCLSSMTENTENNENDQQPIISIPTKNVLGGQLQACCFSPMTGFYRDGFCNTGPDDAGRHTVCVRVDADFLAFSKSKGNDLSTPYPMYNFPGLKPGDSWCLCALRWKEALQEDKAPLVILASTHAKTLQVVSLEDLMRHASGDSTSEDEMQ
jgi:uncharacterized protein (DUF2237 family)